MSAKIPSEYLQTLAVMVQDIVVRTFQKTGKVSFTKEPELHLKDIVEYDRKMRVNALEKFNGAGYISAVNFYKSQKEKDLFKACGALVVYLNEKTLGKIMEAAGFERFNEDDSEAVIDKCCQFCEKICAEFMNILETKGYPLLMASEAIGNRNTIPQGVSFSYDQYDKYEINFFVKEDKAVVIEITMTSLK